MVIVGWILVGLLALVLGAVLVLIATPLHLRLEGTAGETGAQMVLDARTLWGLSPRVRVVDTTRPGKAKKPKGKKKKTKSQSGWRPSLSSDRVWRLGAGVPELLRGMLTRVHFDRLAVDARFGTGDPAETGQIYGWLMPLVYPLAGARHRLQLEPDFQRACFEAKGEAALHLTPLALTFPAIRLAWDVFVRPT